MNARERDYALRTLASAMIDALGVNCKPEAADARTIMEHSIAQACLELELVEQAMEPEATSSGSDTMHSALYALQGVRKRLAFVQERAADLAEVMAEVATGRLANEPRS